MFTHCIEGEQENREIHRTFIKIWKDLHKDFR